MSRDVQLAFSCPHVIGEERVALGSDRRTLYTSKPINGPSLLRVQANDGTDVSPYTGLVTLASVKSYRREPYKVTLANRTLVVVSQLGAATVTLPQGYLSAARVVDTLNAGAGSLIVATSSQGYVTVTDKGNPGPASRVQLSGSALEALGFDLQSGAKGRTVVPPWKLYSRNVVNPQDAVDSLGYYVGFDAPVAQNPYFTVTYPVAPNLCLRCLTTEVENDYRFDAQGEALVVRDANLLYQSVLKYLLTNIQSNMYHTWYGSTLKSLIGTKVLGGTSSGIRQSVSTALSTFKALQDAQAKYQRITAKERLFAVDSIAVSQSPADPTVFYVQVEVRNYANEPVDITISYAAPGTFALPGTNQIALGNY